MDPPVKCTVGPGGPGWGGGAACRECFSRSEVGRASLLLLLLLLLLFLLLVVLLLSGSLLTTILLTLGSGGISSLLAWPLAEPLGQLLGGALGELLELLLPDGIEGLGTDDLPATLVQLLPVLVGPGVGPPLVLGVHADHGGVLANKGLRVKTLLEGLLPQLSLLPLLQLHEVPLLLHLLLLVVVLVGLKLDDNVEQLVGLGLQVISVHLLESKGLDPDGEGNLLLLLQLLLGLGHLLAGITTLGASSGLLGGGSSLVGLLGIQHLLPLGLGLFEPLLLLLSLSGPLVSFLLPQLLLLLLLSLVKLLLLLGPDLLPLGLLLLQLLQLLLLLLPGLPPFCDVLLECRIQLLLVLCLLVGHDCARGILDDTAPDVVDRVGGR